MIAPASISIPTEAWQVMLEHVQRCLPYEACGLLAGKGGRAIEALPVTNVDQSAVSFRMDPDEQVRAFFEIEDSGLEVVGIYHSHPQGPHQPSERDLAEAAYPETAYLIWEQVSGNWECRAFVLSHEGALEIPIRLAD